MVSRLIVALLAVLSLTACTPEPPKPEIGSGIVCPVPGSCVGSGVAISKLATPPGHGTYHAVAIDASAYWADGAAGGGGATYTAADGGGVVVGASTIGLIPADAGESLCESTSSGWVSCLLIETVTANYPLYGVRSGQTETLGVDHADAGSGVLAWTFDAGSGGGWVTAVPVQFVNATGPLQCTKTGATEACILLGPDVSASGAIGQTSGLDAGFNELATNVCYGAVIGTSSVPAGAVCTHEPVCSGSACTMATTLPANVTGFITAMVVVNQGDAAAHEGGGIIWQCGVKTWTSGGLNSRIWSACTATTAYASTDAGGAWAPTIAISSGVVTITAPAVAGLHWAATIQGALVQ